MSQQPQVLLGSEYLRNPPDTPKHLPDLSLGLCLDLSALKTLLHQYRKLDDAISTRMNRAHALAQRDPARPYSELAPSECSKFYEELQGLWTGRDQVLQYCTTAAEAHLQQEKQKILGQNSSSSTSLLNRSSLSDLKLDADPDAIDRLYAEEVKVQQIRGEQQVESIIRNRSLMLFFSRCRGFQPPSQP